MRWLPVFLLLCLLAGIAGSRLLVTGTEPQAPPLPGDGAPLATDVTDPGVEAAEPTAADALEPGPTDDMWLEEPLQPEPGRTDAAALAKTPTGPRVRVVRGSPPQPVADAEVFHLTRAEGEARLGQRTDPPFCWPAQWGKRTSTDAEGLVALPPARAPWLVVARSGSEFAFAQVPPGRRTVTMLLQNDESVVLATLRADDRPAPAMPVALLQQLGTDEARTIWEGVTGADGRATVAHFQLVRQQMQDPETKEPPPERFAAVLMAPCAPPVVAEFPGRPASSEPVILRVPTLGGIEVLLTDHRGTPLLSPAMVGAAAAGPVVGAGPVRVGQGMLHRRASKPVGTAPVLLPLVGIGQQLRVFARFADERRPADAVVQGPQQSGSVARVTLSLGAQHVLLAGRVVRRDGSTVAAARLPASLWRLDRDILRPTLHTTDDGRFDLVLSGRPDAGPFWLEVRHTVLGALGEPPQMLGAHVHIPHLAGGQRVELGSIMLDLLPPLASGVVRDDLDQAVPNADVRIQQEIPPDPNRARDRNAEPWRDLVHLATRTAEDGTFVLWGRLPPGTLRVRADSDLHFADSVPLRTAGQQVRIRIERNGILRGRALLPDFLADGAVTLTLRPFDETLPQRNTRRIDLGRRDGGRFRIEPLRTGRYDAIVELRNQTEPLLVVPDVFVTPGEVRNGRLDDLDLRQSLFRYRLRAVDARGTPEAFEGPILARLQTRQGSIAEAGFRWRGGKAELITCSTLADLQFFGRGVLPQRLVFSPGDHDVYLQHQRPALLHLPGARALCGPERRVRVSVILSEATGYPESLGGIDQRSGQQFSFPRWDLGKSSGAWLGLIDTVEVPLMKSGRYEVLLRPHATASERSPQASLSLGTFDLVADSAQPRTVTVPLDAAAVQQMLTNLDQRPRAGGPAQSR